MTQEALKLALEALEESHLLIHGSGTKGGLVYCMDGYYSGCFDIDSNEKQTNEAITAIKEALAEQPAPVQQEPQKSGILGSPSDPEICNERSAQACGPVYCGDSGGYCNKCPKQTNIHAVKSCKGMNCGCTDGRSHSLECLAELAAAIAGGVFVQKALAQPQQEPVVFYRCNGCGHAYEQVHPTSCDCMEGSSFEQVNYYTTPPQRKPLTEERIQKIWDVAAGAIPGWSRHIAYARAIEAAYGIKE